MAAYGRVAAFARVWRDDYRRQQQRSGRDTAFSVFDSCFYQQADQQIA